MPSRTIKSYRPATDSTNVRNGRAVVRLKILQAARSLNSSSAKRPSDVLRTAFTSVSNSASVRFSSRFLLLSILCFFVHFLPRISRDRRACAIKTGHCASRLTFTRRARRLPVYAVQQKERGERASGSIDVDERATIDRQRNAGNEIRLIGR